MLGLTLKRLPRLSKNVFEPLEPKHSKVLANALTICLLGNFTVQYPHITTWYTGKLHFGAHVVSINYLFCLFVPLGATRVRKKGGKVDYQMQTIIKCLCWMIIKNIECLAAVHVNQLC